MNPRAQYHGNPPGASAVRDEVVRRTTRDVLAAAGLAAESHPGVDVRFDLDAYNGESVALVLSDVEGGRPPKTLRFGLGLSGVAIARRVDSAVAAFVAAGKSQRPGDLVEATVAAVKTAAQRVAESDPAVDVVIDRQASDDAWVRACVAVLEDDGLSRVVSIPTGASPEGAERTLRRIASSLRRSRVATPASA